MGKDIKLTTPQNYGHAPRNSVIIDFNTAFARGELEAILTYFADNAIWDMVGNKKMQGKGQILL